MDDKSAATILLIIVLTIFLLFSTLVFSDFGLGEIWAREEGIKPSETLEEAGEKGEELAKEAQEKLPGIMRKIWQEEVMPVWQGMWDWTKNWWGNTVWPWLSNIFQERVKPSMEKEVEKRKPIVEEEMEKAKEKAKEEIKKEASEVGESLWERFKELFE